MFENMEGFLRVKLPDKISSSEDLEQSDLSIKQVSKILKSDFPNMIAARPFVAEHEDEIVLAIKYKGKLYKVNLTEVE